MILANISRQRWKQHTMPWSQRNDSFTRHPSAVMVAGFVCAAGVLALRRGREAGCRAGTASCATHWTAACSSSAGRLRGRPLPRRRFARQLWPCSEMGSLRASCEGISARAWHLHFACPLLRRQEPATDVLGRLWATRSFSKRVTPSSCSKRAPSPWRGCQRMTGTLSELAFTSAFCTQAIALIWQFPMPMCKGLHLGDELLQ